MAWEGRLLTFWFFAGRTDYVFDETVHFLVHAILHRATWMVADVSLSLSFSLSFSNRFDGGGGEVAAIKGHGNEGTDATVSRPVMKSRTPSERGFSLPLSDPRDREMALQLFLFPRGIICSCLIDAFLKKGK